VRRSDKRVPHEVLPAKSFRYAITTWFMSTADAAEARANLQHQVRPERAQRFDARPAPSKGSTGLAACPHVQPACPTPWGAISCRKAAPLTSVSCARASVCVNMNEASRLRIRSCMTRSPAHCSVLERRAACRLMRWAGMGRRAQKEAQAIQEEIASMQKKYGGDAVVRNVDTMVDSPGSSPSTSYHTAAQSASQSLDSSDAYPKGGVAYTGGGPDFELFERVRGRRSIRLEVCVCVALFKTAW